MSVLILIRAVRLHTWLLLQKLFIASYVWLGLSWDWCFDSEFIYFSLVRAWWTVLCFSCILIDQLSKHCFLCLNSLAMSLEWLNPNKNTLLKEIMLCQNWVHYYLISKMIVLFKKVKRLLNLKHWLIDIFLVLCSKWLLVIQLWQNPCKFSNEIITLNIYDFDTFFKEFYLFTNGGHIHCNIFHQIIFK